MNTKNNIDILIELLKNIKIDLITEIETLADKIVYSFKRGGKLLVFGNGGSAADAQHLAAELVGRFKIKRCPLPAIALNCNTSVLTSLSNDFSFDEIFAKQIEALAKPEDIMIAISTSGNSPNVINGVKKAKEIGCYSCGLLGNDGGKLANLVNLPIIVNSPDTPRVQECHILICHLLCELIEEKI